MCGGGGEREDQKDQKDKKSPQKSFIKKSKTSNILNVFYFNVS